MSAQRFVALSRKLARLGLVVGAVFAVSACNKSGSSNGSAGDKAGAAIEVPGVRVAVDGQGFTPSQITLEKGKSGTVTFVRTTDETCATKVVFPELNIKKDLPLNQPVSVDLPTADAKTYVFQCGMGMYKSSVVVN